MIHVCRSDSAVLKDLAEELRKTYSDVEEDGVTLRVKADKKEVLEIVPVRGVGYIFEKLPNKVIKALHKHLNELADDITLIMEF